jgi:hypothetical protein
VDTTNLKIVTGYMKGQVHVQEQIGELTCVKPQEKNVKAKK